MTHARLVATRAIHVFLVLAVASLAACTSAAGSAAPSIPAARPSVAVVPPPTVASSEPSASEAPSAAASELATAAPTAVATDIDPCQVVPPAEASTLAGSTFAPSKATTTSNNARMCSYGQQGLFFNVIVTVAPDAASAKAQEPAFKAEIEQQAAQGGLGDMKLTELPDFQPGVDAAVMSGSTTVDGQKVNGIALYALKGAVLLAITELSWRVGPDCRRDGGRGQGRPRTPPVTAAVDTSAGRPTRVTAVR